MAYRGRMPALYLKLAGAAAVLLLVAGVAAGLYHRGYVAGEAKVRAADARAVVDAQKAVEAQKQADLKTSSDAVAGLKDELQKLKDHPPAPTPVRLCVSSPRRPVSAPAQPAGGASGSASAARELPGVSAGAGTGVDVGAGVQLVAEAGDVLAARDRACIEWARGIAK